MISSGRKSLLPRNPAGQALLKPPPYLSPFDPFWDARAQTNKKNKA